MVAETSGHKLIQCGKDCTGCMYCDGGLAHCEICGGAEASLPIHCPGRKMSQAEEDAIQRRDITFINGFWINLREVVYSTAAGVL